MAIYGDLADHALTDLAAVLGNRSGTLFLHQVYHGRTVEMTLVQGVVRDTYLDGFPIREVQQLQDVIAQITLEREGAFEFDVKVRPVGTDTFNLPFGELVRQVALSGTVPAGQLPSAATRFVRVPGVTQSSLTEQAEWQRLLPHLSAGASAEELALLTGQSQQAVREQLYRYRVAGLIVPRRAADGSQIAPADSLTSGPSGQATPAAVDAAPTSEHPAAPLIHRMLGALRRLTGAGRA